MPDKRKTFYVALSALVSGILVLAMSPAFAKTTEITVNTVAWYGQDQVSREEKDPLGNTYTVESPNPFCPSIPGSLGAIPGTCAEGRLPIEVRNGNYEPEEQNKISAVGFDMSLIPLGSKVQKFTATFLEAKAGCYERQGGQGGPSDRYCEETDPINVEGKELQACIIEGFLTEGEGRPFKEAPRFTCSDTDPVAKRKEVKTKDGGVEHVWTFDLTKFAQGWVKELSTTTAVMLVGHAPEKEADRGDPNDTWRVVLTGPKFEAGNIPGIETEISFIPGETPTIPVPPTTGTTGTTGSFGDTTGTTGFGDTGTSTLGTGTATGGVGGTTGAEGTEGEAPAAAEELPLEVAGAETEPIKMPGYVWLAVLAGIIGFSMVRSIVLESATGIRPNGVLAQIQRLNAERNGGAASGSGTTSPFAPLAAGFTAAKQKIGALTGKLNFTKKG
ncbi:MAG: hypothetical protein M3N53_06925 [Actinomycetota bacterium]|nr:hypothetical protein [Actinomycetota bacterium]